MGLGKRGGGGAGGGEEETMVVLGDFLSELQSLRRGKGGGVGRRGSRGTPEVRFWFYHFYRLNMKISKIVYFSFINYYTNNNIYSEGL